jgi:DNA/RNA-binding domain of Phe-tRNA-synthetase-like protein
MTQKTIQQRIKELQQKEAAQKAKVEKRKQIEAHRSALKKLTAKPAKAKSNG